MDRFLVVFTIAAVVAIGAILVFDIDISAARYFRNDVVVRDAWPASEIPRPIYSDTCAWTLWIPSDWFVWDSLRGGMLPLWDRLQGGGYSPVLTVQNGVFHPFRWIVAAVPRNASPSVLIILILYAALAGSWMCFRLELGASSGASSAGALIYAFSGAVASCVQWSGDAVPLAHLPWVAFFTLRACRLRTIGSVVALAFVIALLLLSGHPTHIAIILALAIALAASSLPNVLMVTGSIAGALFLTAFAFLPAIVAASKLWTYKVETHHGSSYLLYTTEGWWRALLSMVWDLHPRGAVIDSSTFYLYFGPAVLLLAVTGAYKALQRPFGAVLIFVTLGFAIFMLPGPWMAGLAEFRPVYWANRWYYSGAVAFLIAAFAAWGFDALRQRWRPIAYLFAAIMAVQYGARMEQVLAPQRWQPVVGGKVIGFLRGERIVGFIGLTHQPNASRITGVEDIRWQSPMFTRRTEQFWETIDPHLRRWSFPTFHVTDRVDSGLLRDFGVRYMVESRLPQDQRPSHITDLPIVYSAPSVNIRRIPGNTIRPRAHFADGVIGDVKVRYPDDQHVILTTHSKTGGLVVLHDAYDEGWRSTVPVNILSRGVFVAAGDQRIELEYVLPGFRAGLVISALTALALIALKYAADRAR
jgi:hypothetical protein